jgi:pre-mRNA-splicing factor SPF27
MASASFQPLDALPYVDVTHPDYEAYALTMIEEEMIAMDSDPTVNTSAEYYLKDLKQRAYKPQSSLLVKTSLEAVAANGGAAPARPASFRPASFLAKPTGALQNDVQAWKKAVSDAKVAVEEENLRLVNLELLSSFGQNAHLSHLAELQVEEDRVKAELHDLRNECDLINAERKQSQDSIVPKYTVLTRKWAELVHKNGALGNIVQELEEREAKKQKV